MILIILLLVGGIIYATFASNPMSFDDLIELRFLPSRRRRRDQEYFEQLKSMISPREVNRVTGEESEPQQSTSEIAGGRAEIRSMVRRRDQDQHHPALHEEQHPADPSLGGWPDPRAVQESRR